MENRFKLVDAFIGSLSPIADLYDNTWSENSTCLLHAPRNLDKSALAVDIALSITARDIPVFYLTGSRLSTKLLDKMKGNRHLYVHQSEFSSPDDPTDFADIVFKDLEDAIAETGAKVFIIDSLSRIASLSFGRNASPSFLMKRLVTLQVRNKVSILGLAHDTTKAATRALINLADSELTITETEDNTSDEKNADKEKEKKTAATTPQAAPAESSYDYSTHPEAFPFHHEFTGVWAKPGLYDLD